MRGECNGIVLCGLACSSLLGIRWLHWFVAWFVAVCCGASGGGGARGCDTQAPIGDGG